MSNLFLMSRTTYVKALRPVAKIVLNVGLGPNIVTIIGTVGSVISALTLFPIGQLWWGAFIIFIFTLADILDGAMARELGGGTKFGSVLDSTCDRIVDGAIFAGLIWWSAFDLGSTTLAVTLIICLIASQVISYIKARAEASGLHANSGIIERPERLIITLTGAGISDIPFFHLTWLLDISIWVLTLASLITIIQRLHEVRISSKAIDSIRSINNTQKNIHSYQE